MCKVPKKRLKIVEALSMVGFKGLDYIKYIHVDNDDLKPI
jgi:hypothetical protein